MRLASPARAGINRRRGSRRAPRGKPVMRQRDSWDADVPTNGPLEPTIGPVIALLMLGAKRLPEAGRSPGQAIRWFGRFLTGADRDRAGPIARGLTRRPSTK